MGKDELQMEKKGKEDLQKDWTNKLMWIRR